MGPRNQNAKARMYLSTFGNPQSHAYFYSVQYWYQARNLGQLAKSRTSCRGFHIVINPNLTRHSDIQYDVRGWVSHTTLVHSTKGSFSSAWNFDLVSCMELHISVSRMYIHGNGKGNLSWAHLRIPTPGGRSKYIVPVSNLYSIYSVHPWTASILPPLGQIIKPDVTEINTVMSYHLEWRSTSVLEPTRNRKLWSWVEWKVQDYGLKNLSVH